jgi:hypothetical protein
MKYSNFYYKQIANNTYKELFYLDRNLNDDNYIKEVKELIENLIISKSNTMFINELRDQKIESERKNNFEISDIAETELDYKKRIEKEINYINNNKAMLDSQLSLLKIYSIEPIYSTKIFSRNLKRIEERLLNYDSFGVFSTYFESDYTRYIAGKNKNEYKKDLNEAETNYRKFGIAETNEKREYRLNILDNYEKNGEYLHSYEIQIASYDSITKKSSLVKHQNRERNLLMYGNIEGNNSKNAFNEIEKVENYKKNGLPETVSEKHFREYMSAKIHNWNDIPDNFKDGTFTKKDWSKEISKLNERIDNLKNTDFAETHIERKYRLETEKNYDLYKIAESNEEREKRLEIENNIVNGGLAYSNDELESFYEYTEKLKLHFEN